MTEPHIYFEAGDKTLAPILMLHGTGGSESDLASIADYLLPNAPKLGIRGRLIEDGATRYFKHLPDGGFDLNSLEQESIWLMAEVDRQVVAHGLDFANMMVLGYSNGANVAAYTMLNGLSLFKTAILLHPMQLTPVKEPVDLSQVQIWGSHGSLDPIVSGASFTALRSELTAAGATFSAYEAEQSHNVTDAELADAKQWLSRL